MPVGVRFERYGWAHGHEAMLRFGPEGGPTVLAAPALFEEANRTRTLLVGILRRVAQAGIGAALPDLPGAGESLVSTHDATLADWRDAFAACAAGLPGPVHIAAIRGGALVDGLVEPAARWYWSPVSGDTLTRDLRRIRAAAGSPLDPAEDPMEVAGNLLSRHLLDALRASEPTTTGHLRVVRLDGDPRPADRHLAGAPPWRLPEPRTDPDLEAALADDLIGWVRTCAG